MFEDLEYQLSESLLQSLSGDVYKRQISTNVVHQTFDFTPADQLTNRQANRFYHLGDLTFRLRANHADSWANYSTAADRRPVAALPAACLLYTSLATEKEFHMGTKAKTHAPNNPPTRLTGAEIVWATLVGEGVTDVFGYPGGAILPVYDALRKFPIHHTLVRHEQGAALSLIHI